MIEYEDVFTVFAQSSHGCMKKANRKNAINCDKRQTKLDACSLNVSMHL